MKRIYYCDPEKNKDCKKTGCFKVGNACCFTTFAKYQQLDADKINPVQALTALEYLNDAYDFHYAEPEFIEEHNKLKQENERLRVELERLWKRNSPKKWIYDNDDFNTWVCPNCKECFCLEVGTVIDNNYNYCPACGQLLLYDDQR